MDSLRRIFHFIFLIIFFACQTNSDISKQSFLISASQKTKLHYAKHFEIFKSDSCYTVKVFNPWQFAKNKSYIYNFTILKPTNFNAISIPVHRIICLSTSHIGFVAALNQQQAIVGVSGSQFINDSHICELIKERKIADVGYEQSLNYELILSLKPDVIIAYGVESRNIGYITKLEELGLPVIFVAEYLEETPLAKAEWLKFFGIIFNLEEKSDSIFSVINSEYNSIRQSAWQFPEKPTVFAGLPWKDSWYIAGGMSNLACLIKDAGASYVWNNDTSKESFPLNLEMVFNKAGNADFWINSGSANSLKEISSTDSRLTLFKAFQFKKIYNNNSKCNLSGGNDYWESGIVNPQIILKDIVKIFHPQAFPNYKIYYYKKLE